MILAVLCGLAVALPAGAPAAAEPAAPWTAREARHLWNRAGFGIAALDLPAVVAAGRRAAVEALFAVPASAPERFSDRERPGRRGIPLPFVGAGPQARSRSLDRRRDEFHSAMEEYEHWWVGAMLQGVDPLRDRMTLFWHGLIPTSKFTTRQFNESIDQHRFLRAHALGSIRAILLGMAQDPAMLRYLDNATNVKDHPNENWARELMELFSMGEGNYTEQDVQEAARAFTGWSIANHRFVFNEEQHDDGDKTVLGVTGRLDGGDVIDLILEHPAAARYLARRMLEHVEGTTPDPDRLAEYAAALRDGGFEVAPFLRKLFLDDRFYRDEVVGTRVAGPIDFLVGSSIRLGMRDTEQVVFAGGVVLGQYLFAPPSVKGWDGGLDWINSSTIIQRGNLAGVLLGQVRVDGLLTPEAETPGGLAPTLAESQGYVAIHRLQAAGWTPSLDLSTRLGIIGGEPVPVVIERLLERLLAVAPSAGLQNALLEAASAPLASGFGTVAERLGDPARREGELRRLALLALGLPEAQLH